jgi:hypothetical protein
MRGHIRNSDMKSWVAVKSEWRVWSCSHYISDWMLVFDLFSMFRHHGMKETNEPQYSNICVFVCVWVSVCVCICEWVGASACAREWVRECEWVCVLVSEWVRVRVRGSEWMSGCECECVRVSEWVSGCECVCVRVSEWVRVCVCVCVCVYVGIWHSKALKCLCSNAYFRGFFKYSSLPN